MSLWSVLCVHTDISAVWFMLKYKWCLRIWVCDAEMSSYVWHKLHCCCDKLFESTKIRCRKNSFEELPECSETTCDFRDASTDSTVDDKVDIQEHGLCIVLQWLLIIWIGSLKYTCKSFSHPADPTLLHSIDRQGVAWCQTEYSSYNYPWQAVVIASCLWWISLRASFTINRVHGMGKLSHK